MDITDSVWVALQALSAVVPGSPVTTPTPEEVATRVSVAEVAFELLGSPLGAWHAAGDDLLDLRHHLPADGAPALSGVPMSRHRHRCPLLVPRGWHCVLSRLPVASRKPALARVCPLWCPGPMAPSRLSNLCALLDRQRDRAPLSFTEPGMTKTRS
jgi:hypothetical protein